MLSHVVPIPAWTAQFGLAGFWSAAEVSSVAEVVVEVVEHVLDQVLDQKLKVSAVGSATEVGEKVMTSDLVQMFQPTPVVQHHFLQKFGALHQWRQKGHRECYVQGLWTESETAPTHVASTPLGRTSWKMNFQASKALMRLSASYAFRRRPPSLASTHQQHVRLDECPFRPAITVAHSAVSKSSMWNL